MHLFVSAGEPSGDLHAANLVRAVRQLDPDATFAGFGGERLTAAGCPLVYPLCDYAVVGILPAVASVPHFRRVLALADRSFRERCPDAVVLIDYPGFHWWLARRAKAHGIPVVYFVPPQLWAWGGWRAGKMRRLIDHVLCTLPFEADWFRANAIPAHWVGHPYFDELRGQRLDGEFMARQRALPGTVVALLPGSRRQELENNPESMIRAAERIHRRRPDVRFLVACLRDEHRLRVEGLLRGRGLPAEVHAGRTPEILHLCHSALAVSGSVGLELLYRNRPAVVVYRVNKGGQLLARALQQCRYISLVNLLAGKELFPEYLTARCEAEAMAGHVLRWLDDRHAYEELCGELKALRDRVSEPGACGRAAAYVLDVMRGRAAPRAA